MSDPRRFEDVPFFDWDGTPLEQAQPVEPRTRSAQGSPRLTSYAESGARASTPRPSAVGLDRRTGLSRTVSRPLSDFSSTPERFRRPSEMPRADFGSQSFAGVVQSPDPSVMTVTAAVQRLRDAVQQQLSGFWISGEVSNFSRAYSGHVYFTLKDDGAQIRAVFFSGSQRRFPVNFQDGDRIEVRGESDVYVKGGDLQVRVLEWRAAGLGALYEAYLKLKGRLEHEGLFAATRKKPLPRFVSAVAVVTSLQAAALQDVRRTLARRMPWVRITVFDTLVQGQEAPERIVSALARADASGADAVLLVRGGGSFEDLFAFSDERVVRAVAAMRTPIVAGIGHETDETLAALAADICASTPTAAAEQLGADLRAWLARLDEVGARLASALARRCDELDQALDRLEERTRSVPRLLEARSEALERRAQALERTMCAQIQNAETALGLSRGHFERSLSVYLAERFRVAERAARLLKSPDGALAAKRSAFESAAQRLTAAAPVMVLRAEERLATLGRRLPNAETLLAAREAHLTAIERNIAAFNPDTVLLRGFTLVSLGEEVITAAASLKVGDNLSIRFSDASVKAMVTETPTKKVGL